MRVDRSQKGVNQPPSQFWSVLAEEYVVLRHVDEGRPEPTRSLRSVRRFRRWLERPPREGGSADSIGRLARTIHGDRHGLSALCLSGGGIRSATFNLGVLQALASAGLLSGIDYLSTVSGGGYIGHWLSGLVHRSPDGLKGVEESLAQACPSSSRSSRAAEPSYIRHLREHSNYLTPRVGLFSGDTWAVIAIYLRNLVLNSFILLPAILAILLAAWLYVSALHGAMLVKIGAPAGTISWRVFAAHAVPIACWAVALGTAYGKRPSLVSPRIGPPIPMEIATERWDIRWFIIFPTIVYALTDPLASLATLPVAGMPLDYAALSLEIGGFSLIPALIGVAVSAWRRRCWIELFLKVPATVCVALAVWWVIHTKTSSPEVLLPIAVLFITLLALFGRTLVLFPLLVALPTMIAIYANRALLSLLTSDAGGFHLGWYAAIAPLLRIGAMWMFLTLMVGLTSERHGLERESDREWFGRFMGVLLLISVAWFVAICLAINIPLMPKLTGTSALGLGSTAGIVTVIGGLSSKTNALRGQLPRRTLAKLRELIPEVAAGIFVAFVCAGLAFAASKLVTAIVEQGYGWKADALHVIANYNASVARVDSGLKWSSSLGAFPATTEVVSFVVGGACILSLVFQFVVNVNRFSLHGMYRNRLIRAYLGASRGDQRNPNPLTGFDSADNFNLFLLGRPSRIAPDDIIHDDPAVRTSMATLLDAALNVSDLQAMLMSRRRLGPNDLDAVDPALRPRLSFLLRRYRLDRRGRRRLGINRDVDLLREALSHTPDDTSTLRYMNRLILEQFLVVLKDGRAEPLLRPRVPRPFHVTNAALNLVAGNNLAWQNRKASSFTFTPLTCGFDKGYRRSIDYGGGVSAGTAMAISGAVASPNMGYHSSPLVGFAMTLLNVRLGWWFGNPAFFGQFPQWPISLYLRCVQALQRRHPYRFTRSRQIYPLRDRFAWWLRRRAERLLVTYHRDSPRFEAGVLADEALGRTDDENPYIYLSDGGHFDNLGLYEMVRRRCRTILVCDASCDHSTDLTDFAGAIRKIRVDLGIRVTVRNSKLRARSVGGDGAMHSYCTVGRIHYGDRDGDVVRGGVKLTARENIGHLIYLKPTLRDDEPLDIFNYGKLMEEFPHESTSDQWFDESQFESYRLLGETIVRQIVELAGTSPSSRARGAAPDTLEALYESLNGCVHAAANAPAAKVRLRHRWP